MAEIKRWEYRVEMVGSALSTPKDEHLEAVLNEWGEEGWELVAAHHPESSNKVRLIAKRPIASPIRRRGWPA